ncbi:MAG TPA: PaaI family thioesterase [Vitreimonas sp.]|nr:PaaI family thioesterase [Vitreimonas sp.]
MTSERGGRAIAGPGVRAFELVEHNCFACGSLNEHGLQLVLHVEPGRSWTELTLEERFEGWAGIAHGGILATILDEVMAWALVGDDTWGLTARMSIDFRRPARVGQLIRAEGRVLRTRRRLVETTGRIADARTGEELASATATYMAADPVRRQALQERYGFRFAGSGPPSDLGVGGLDTTPRREERTIVRSSAP